MGGYGINYLGSQGCYWSSDSDKDGSFQASGISFDLNNYGWNYGFRVCSGLLIRGVCGECPPLQPYSLVDAEYASLFYGGSGYSIVFFESVDRQEDYKVYTHGKWFKIDIPKEIMNREMDMTDKLDGANWTFYFKSEAFDYYYSGQFESGSMKAKVDEDAGTINFEIDAIASIDGRVVHCCYSGPFVEVSNFIQIN